MIDKKINIHEIHSRQAFPAWITRDNLALLLHGWLKPYEDTVEDIRRGIENAFTDVRPAGTDPSGGGKEASRGFILVAEAGEKPLGALVMLRTGMTGYIPENLLLFIAVDPAARGKGVGGRLVKHGIDLCDGNVKLHVEYDNPAKKLYERIGFTNKYAEMRYEK